MGWTLRSSNMANTDHIKRYVNMPKLIRQLPPGSKTLMEIGVYHGVNGRDMIQTALETVGDVYYYGFDFFGDMTIKMAKEEFGHLPATEEVAYNRLRGPGVTVELIKGDTKDTLPEFAERGIVPDFVFIDGGHSFETVANDWKWVEKMILPRTIIVLDDYLSESKKLGWGCNRVIDSLDESIYSVEVLEPCDTWSARKADCDEHFMSDTSFVKVIMK